MTDAPADAESLSMLSPFRVLDLTDERGHLCGAILAQMGADVIAVEPPEGSKARWLGPFAGDVEDSERSLHHWAYNRGKRSVVLDLQTDEDASRLRDLTALADILIESAGPGVMDGLGLGYGTLGEVNPELVYVSISPFGSDGPKADWTASDLTLQAAAVNMAMTGDVDRAPVRTGGLFPQAFHNAASEAAGAALIALWERQTRSGLGQHVDMSAQQSMNQACQSYALSTPIGATPPIRSAGGVLVEGLHIQLMWPCADGHASVTFLFGPGFRAFTQNLMDWVHEEGYCDEATRDKNWTEYAMMLLDGREPVSEYERLKQVLHDFFATKTKAELLDAAMSRRVLITPVWTADEVIDSHQLAAREYWETVTQDLGDDGPTDVLYPGRYARFSVTPMQPLGPPPKLGEHTDEVMAEFGAAGARTRPRIEATGADITEHVASTALPLENVKVLDFMWAMAGPAASRVLADYGADIIRVESETRLEVARSLQPFRDDIGDPEYSALYNNMNAGKRGICLDMSKPPALEVIWDLIDWADVIVESFSPKAMAGWGMGPEQVRERRPDVIMASSCLMGQTGPLAMLAGFGTMAAAISGFFYPVGWPDRAPCGPFGAYTDYTSPRWLVAAVMGALEHRRRTGEGQYIDFSQAESALHLMAPALLDRTVNGRVAERVGNRDRHIAPQGVYRTAATVPGAAADAGPKAVEHDDNWIAIACVDDAQWQSLAAQMGRSDLADLTLAERHERHDDLDSVISAWIRGQDGMALMYRLQDVGVAAHIVQNSPEYTADPQIIHRGQQVEVPHAKQGTTVVDGSRFVLSRTPAGVTYGGPTLGEHSFEILTDVLGYDGDRIAELAVAELLT
ncbi:CaiB/BaiF CoA transferase family protein [Candidatus Poriferisodalis sp.]|uniref:CaiB/BaiF CoA transferase family protein n=1 Tax=Candidatus Poriferisodalis sp. TaxID=3101277 RepID=UPI003B5BD274